MTHYPVLLKMTGRFTTKKVDNIMKSHPSKWDWYTIGGRWNNLIRGNVKRVRDLSKTEKINLVNTIYAVTDKHRWQAPGRALYFGFTTEIQLQRKKFKEVVFRTINNAKPDTIFVVIDAHY